MSKPPPPPPLDQFEPFEPGPPKFRDSVPKPASGLAITSFVLGLLSLLTCFLTGLPALITGIIALNRIDRRDSTEGGRGYAITGVVLGALSGLLIFPVLIALLLPAVQSAREAARRAQCTNNLKQIGLALFNYESTWGTFPPAYSVDASGRPLLSWRVAILPYMEQPSLYEEFHLNEPWDSPHNQALLSRMPLAYRCPSAPEDFGSGTRYQVIVGPGTMLGAQGSRVSDILDGTTNTLACVEAATPVPWTSPGDIPFDAGLPDGGLEGALKSDHPGGTNALLADGSVRFLRSSEVSGELLKAMATRAGGEMVTLP